MNTSFEDEHTRIRARIQTVITSEGIVDLDEDADIVADALIIRTQLLERKLHRLQGAVVFKTLGFTNFVEWNQSPGSSEQ
jgi:hypothetical protein